MDRKYFAWLTICLLMVAFGPSVVSAEGIIHDAEQDILEAQHGEKWAAEDKEIDKKLAELEKKHGKKPNVIHIMWDDMKYGAIGHQMLNQVTGYTSPNINKIARA